MLFHSLIPVVMVSGPLENLHMKSKPTQCTMYFADNSIEPVAKPFKLQTVENCFRYLEMMNSACAYSASSPADYGILRGV